MKLHDHMIIHLNTNLYSRGPFIYEAFAFLAGVDLGGGAFTRFPLFACLGFAGVLACRATSSFGT